MDNDEDMAKYEEWVTQLCRDQGPMDKISTMIEVVSGALYKSYIVHLYRNVDRGIANSLSIEITRMDIEDKSAGQKLLTAIRQV